MHPMQFFHPATLAVLMVAAPAIAAHPPSREEWGAPLVSVTHQGGTWTIRGQKQVVTLRESELTLQIKAGPASWKMVPSKADDMLVRSGGKDFTLRLSDARRIEIVPYDTGFKTGIKITLGDWQRDDPASDAAVFDLTLYLTAAIEGKDEDVVFDIAADEHNTVIRRLDWPTALDATDVEYTVLCNTRGVLLPRDWPKAYNPIRSSNLDGSNPKGDTSEVQSNVIECWSMPWWGFKKGAAAMMVIVETADDAAYQFSHPAGGPTVIGPRWRAQLGKLGYVRTARMCFFPEGNYVDLAKRYRQYAMETGLFVSLKEKTARSPVVTKLIGSPVMRAGILTNVKDGSARANRASNPNDIHRLTTFDERSQLLRQFKEHGLDRLTVVVTGWPRFGYDRQHPDVLPPAPDAGGYEGMRRLAETCNELGYLFSLHDQYRDYYIDAPSYDPQFAVHEQDANGPPLAFPGSRFGDWKEGAIPFMDHWDGGKMAYINGRFMLGHLKKNYQGLFDHGIKPSGTYLDVFGYVPPDEDFSPQHPTTRTDCLRERAKCFSWSRDHLGFVGTEAGCDWTVPFVDITSPLKSKGGVPVPLFNLVYHDAIMTPYDSGDLNGLLNAGVPQISSRDPGAPPLERVRRMAALHKRLALVEMTKHEFLDKDRRKERTWFADGTTVTVDHNAQTAKIEPDL
jgi:hypothetical protein